MQEKAPAEGVRCVLGRRAKANHSMTGRKRMDDIKTRVESLPWDQFGGCLFIARVVSGLKVARAQYRLWCRTWEPVFRYLLVPGLLGLVESECLRAAETVRG